MALDSSLKEIGVRDGTPWSPFGVYSSQVILRELGRIPETAVKVNLPKRLEGVVGEFYKLTGEELEYIRSSTIGRFIILVTKEAERLRREAAYTINHR